uniref:Uncharacterized protein n=1 Tax=Nelumbo nucifera TaxID=4432 RepID=A0A822YYH8_NELNU|nr:TPA_asm: hypothetical protein HUJ06_008363 [Nelumbo nucifera]
MKVDEVEEESKQREREVKIRQSKVVEALRQIAIKLGKTDWDFTVDPCSGQSGWNVDAPNEPRNVIKCECNATCHITTMYVLPY